jgi:ubiquinone/menaquinone biosynthesis C-methylase UbiE
MTVERATPYDQHLAYRDDFMNVGPRFFVRTGLMRRMLKGVSGRIIDVGCGDGFFLEQLLALGFDCVGLDVSEMMIERCRQRISSERLELVCDVIQNYQPNRLFDAAACGETLEHIDDDVAVLTHINRVLRPGGMLVLTVPVDMTLWSEADVAAGHVRRYSKAEIFAKLQQTGFTVQDYAVWGYPLTRTLHFKIREQQTGLMRGSVPTRRRRWLRRLMKPGRYLFLLDNLFNATEKGVGIVVRAVKQ